ncbi:hypothetical protein TGAMA5MH_07581 [Trichoderma gamsii]|uniref:Protein kinase domain-containing protein n=1 Tax=Trichoderma gamsii TaxID=398673 RepID=A0A2K0T4Y2_9HYPO|nr:hypothetical protein TGAMA5MH_07581 [Trichoderma gamsii]
MELGLHGSLNFIIKHSPSALSTLQRRHITIDVAMGLYAIHKAGFMHGDLKPDNIIITGHHDPARGIIAKITDFGGSMETVLKGNKAKHFTPLWAAPEVQNKDADIDWEKADVYSYGLVIGSLWGSCRNGLISWSHGERSSSIFSALAMPVLDDIESHVIANDFLWLGKIEDRTINNVKTQLEHNAIDQSLQNEILELVTTPLRTHFWLRPDTNALALSLVSFASETGRDIVSEEMANTEAEYSEPDKQVS